MKIDGTTLEETNEERRIRLGLDLPGTSHDSEDEPKPSEVGRVLYKRGKSGKTEAIGAKQ